MAICNLADLEEIEKTRETPGIIELYKEAIEIANTEYHNFHVYPYTYYGGYLYRTQRDLNKAVELWRNAADVASRYEYITLCLFMLAYS